MKILTLIIICSFTLACTDKLDQGSPVVNLPLPEINYSPKTFESCHQLNTYGQQKEANYQRVYSKYLTWLNYNQQNGIAMNAAENYVSSSGSNKFNYQTDSQESNVAEADMIATYKSSLFVGRRDRIELVQNANNSTCPEGPTGTCGRVELTDSFKNSDIEDPKMVVLKNNLFVFGQSISNANQHKLIVFDLNLPKPFKKPIESINVSGTYMGARVVDKSFYLVLQDSISGSSPELPDNCQNVYEPILPDFDQSMTKVLKINESGGTLNRQEFAFLGRFDDIYMTDKNLYLVKNNLNWFYWDTRLATSPFKQFVLIQKISLSKDSLAPTSIGYLKGSYHNHWAFKELDENSLAAALTRQESIYSETDPPRVISTVLNNSLHILNTEQAKMNEISKVDHLAPGEDIRAVRYVENYAYIVTFKKTDPLYVINVRDTSNPRLEGELKAPGFSTYLLPMENHQLLGIGFGAIDMGSFAWFDGIQLSKIDVTLASTPTLIEQKQYGGRGSFSDATFDHNSVYFDKESIGLPLVVRDLNDAGNPWGDSSVVKSGYALLSFKNDLKERAFLSHSEWIPQECKQKQNTWYWWQDERKSYDVQRLLKLGKDFISVSRFGVKLHSENSLSEIQRLEFSEPKLECELPTPFDNNFGD